MNLCIHFGFGDYVVCYGAIRELAKREPINLFAISHRSKLHIENIKRLYSSIPNVTVSTDFPGNYPDVVRWGFGDFNNQLARNPNLRIQDYFYNKAGLPLNLLWDNWNFHIVLVDMAGNFGQCLPCSD